MWAMGRIWLNSTSCNLDPCCCGQTLQNGARIIALVNLGFNFICICIFGALFIFYVAKPEELEGSELVAYFCYNLELLVFGRWKITIVLTLYILILIGLMILARYLLLAVNKRDSKALARWCKISTFLLVLQIFSLCTDVFGGLNWVFGVVGILYLGYTIWVVWSFKREVILEKRIHSTVITSENTRLRRPEFFTRL